MARKSEQVLSALETLIRTIAQDSEINFYRNPEKDHDLPAKGRIDMFDGDPGEPETTLGIIQYTYDHAVEFELSVQDEDHDTRIANMEALILLVSNKLESDPDLGALLDEDIEPEAPEIVHPDIDGGVTTSIASFKVFCMYTTDNPLK